MYYDAIIFELSGLKSTEDISEEALESKLKTSFAMRISRKNNIIKYGLVY